VISKLRGCLRLLQLPRTRCCLRYDTSVCLEVKAAIRGWAAEAARILLMALFSALTCKMFELKDLRSRVGQPALHLMPCRIAICHL
jgi:hypothetical protein